ncbi:DUF4192 domain-containing protein [Streptomyces sp. NPDC127084]|uniref:DUF4192 domain-containing protein n=1 Tax=Streptomyces sp. NPDC127084 TaxID=3347133 RepID=UPI0036537BAC
MRETNEHNQPPASDGARGPADEHPVTLRGPAELVDALPYLMGFHPTNSVVMVALHGSPGRFGGRLRVGIPASRDEWPSMADQVAECLVDACRQRKAKPDGIIVFLCRDPSVGQTGREVMEELRPFAQRLRTACGSHDVPVYEALCLSDGRFWSYCCPDTRCCPVEGTVMSMPGTSVMAAAAAYAGIQVRGSLRDLEARLTPLRTSVAAEQGRALDSAAAALLAGIVRQGSREQVRAETLRLARTLMERLAVQVPARSSWAEADAHDDKLITHDEAAAVILGLQDRETRDKAAAWMEGPEADHALRLWRALSRRCVGAYGEHGAVPLALAGWVAWSTGDEPAARVALGLSLRADPEYLFARLLHQACNDGLDPEELRRCLREHADSEVGETGRTGPARSGHTVRKTGRRRDGLGSPATPGAADGARRPSSSAREGTGRRDQRTPSVRSRQKGPGVGRGGG